MSADRRPADRARRTARLALAGLPLLLGACSWFTDFKEQPKIKPWQAQYAGNDTTPFRGQPQYSVPVTGERVPAYVVSHQGSMSWLPGVPPTAATIDSMAGLVNPTPPSEASLANGQKYYQINCEVCHGISGRGNGPAVRYGMPAPTLHTDLTKNRTDGYLYGIIRNGRGLMPTYDRIEDLDRWDVVNYVRALQGKIPGVVADTSPVIGYPGENGNTLPGPTRTAPTRPVPHRPQDMQRMMEPVQPPSGARPPADSARVFAAPKGAQP